MQPAIVPVRAGTSERGRMVSRGRGPSAATQDVPCPVPLDVAWGGAATTVLLHDPAAPPANCLAHAVHNARDGVDEVLFLGAAAGSASPGHVILRNTGTAAVREPWEADGQGPHVLAGEYAAAHGQRLLCAVPPEVLRAVVMLDPQARRAALHVVGGPLQSVAHLAFGAVRPVDPNQKPSGTTQTKPADKGTDKSVHAWLDAVGNAMPDADKKALAQTGDDTTLLLGWFDSHKRGDPDITKKMPDDTRKAWDRLTSDDSVNKQITDSKGATNRDSLAGFLKSLDGSADSAKKGFESFKKDNKTPDPIAKQSAVDASILQANLPILDGGATGGKIDQKFNKDDLNAVADSAGNKNLPDPLKNAALFYRDTGHFDQLSNAGLDPGTRSDGSVQGKNFDALLGKATSKTEKDSISSLKSDALQAAVSSSGGDASKVGADYFTSGKSDAGGADKAAAMLKLSDSIGRLNAGEKAYNPTNITNPPEYQGDGPSPGQQRDDFVKDVQGRVDKLAQDKDVQQFIADKMPGALQAIVGSDPHMKDTLQRGLDDTSGNKALQAAFRQKGGDGKPVSTTEALNNFLEKPGFYAQALNAKPDFAKALADAPQDIKDKVKAGYDNITSGGEIGDLVKQKVPADKALVQSAVNKTAYDSVLDPKTVQEGTDKFNDSTTKLGRDQLTGGKTADDLYTGLGVKGPDDPALKKLVDDNAGTLTPQATDKATSGDILTAVRGISDSIRQGAKFDDAVAKFQKDWKSFIPGQVSDAYKAGAMHAASSVLLAGAIGVKVANGTGGSPAQTAGQVLSAAGLMTEGGSKFYATTLDGLKKSVADQKKEVEKLQKEIGQSGDSAAKAKLAAVQASLKVDDGTFKQLSGIGKDVENVGKAVGGVAGNALGLVTGAISAKQSAASGDIGGAAAQGIFAGLNGISAVAGAGEIATYLVPRVATALGTSVASSTAASLSALGGVLGAVGGVVGGAAAVGGLIYLIVKDWANGIKELQQRDKWYDGLNNDFKSFGITMPSQAALYSQPNASPDPAGDLAPAPPY